MRVEAVDQRADATYASPLHRRASERANESPAVHTVTSVTLSQWASGRRRTGRANAAPDQDPGVNDVTNSNEAGTTAVWTITWTLR